MWIATDAFGLLMLEGEQLHRYGVADGLPSPRIVSIHEDESGALWFGTLEGLVYYRDGRFVSLAQAAPALRENMLQVVEDARGSLWLATNRGLFAVARKELEMLVARPGSAAPHIRAYHIADGLRTSEFSGGNTHAGFRANDGTLWLPSIRGMVRVDPSRIRTNELAPPVVLESVIADGKELDLNGELRAPPGSTNWEFHYAALSMVAPERVHFRYKLEGYETNWVEANTRRTAYYTRLPPGKYVFRVVASNDDGLWNEIGAAQSFELLPHFYETTWFKGVCVGVVLLLGFLMFRAARATAAAPLARAESAGRRAHAGPGARQGSGGGRDARQVGVPRQHESRDPHADERRDRHDRAGAGHEARPGAARVRRDDPRQRVLAPAHHQRHPRLLEDRSRQARPGARSGRPARVGPRRRAPGERACAGEGRPGARGHRSAPACATSSATPRASGRSWSTSAATPRSSPSAARSRST